MNPEHTANIFINYRRGDSAGHAGRLFDGLKAHFAGRLFMDLDAIEPGVDFVEAIEKAVGSCEVLIVLIGREWLSIENGAGQRRLDDPADFVRLEVESALARKIRVIPVLVQGAPMPQAEELPPSLARLARRNAIELSDARWGYDVDRLARTIQEVLEETEPAAPVEAPKTAGSRVWLVSLAATVLAAALVLLAVLWTRRAPTVNNNPTQVRQVKLVENGTVPATVVATGPIVNEPAEPPQAETPAPAIPVQPSPVQPPRVTILEPAGGDAVGATVQVQGTVTGLGEQRAFLCIRQKNGSLYPRGELFLRPDGQWSIQLRSSKEKTFDILVVTTEGQEAAQVLSDQQSRDNGIAVLPAGASISSGIVAVKRIGKIREILTAG